ncbi:hypothetical protein NFI96_024774, partial [Prochilodus magdalenae]
DDDHFSIVCMHNCTDQQCGWTHNEHFTTDARCKTVKRDADLRNVTWMNHTEAVLSVQGFTERFLLHLKLQEITGSTEKTEQKNESASVQSKNDTSDTKAVDCEKTRVSWGVCPVLAIVGFVVGFAIGRRSKCPLRSKYITVATDVFSHSPSF